MKKSLLTNNQLITPMRRLNLTIISIVILILIIILIDANMTKKIVEVYNPISYSSPLMKIIKTDTCYDSQSQVFFILFKQEQKLEMWLHSDICRQLIKEFPVELNNQSFGPRLYDNETTIPEGIYNLKPSLDSLIVTINFPNEYDIIKAVADNRPNQHSIISFQSSIRNNAIFLKESDLKEFSGFLNHFNLNNISLIIVPSDIRKTGQFPSCNRCSHWVLELYGQLKLSIMPFRQ